MDKEVLSFLNTLFDPDEEVCVSHNKYGHTSLPLSEVISKNNVQVTNTFDKIVSMDTDSIVLIGINPIKGQRNDENVTAFRNFLVEMDDGDMNDQLAYVKEYNTPYSAAVFSGGKSIHFAICLDESLPSIDVYKFYAKWILNVLKLSDQQTTNPSRSIRFPNNYRDGVKQKLLSVKNRISLDDLKHWLSSFQSEMPKQYTPQPIYQEFKNEQVPFWLRKKLNEGLDFSRGRNNTWFGIALALAKAGCDADTAVAILEYHFQEEHDFKRLEWETTIRSAVKKIRQN